MIVLIFLLLLLIPSVAIDTVFQSVGQITKTSKHSRSIVGGHGTLLHSLGISQTLDAWERDVESAHFSVHYNITGPNAVTLEYATDASDSLEYSWTKEVSDFGFRPPPDSHITIYIKNIDAYGVTYFSGPPYHVINITIDTGLTIDLIRVTCAHEFFHTVQLSYDMSEGNWIIEGTAAWMESKVYPYYTGSGSYVDYVNSYMNNPNRAITSLDYDAVLFWIYIDEHQGGISAIENVLVQTVTKNGIYAVNATLVSEGTTFTKVFKEWTIANYLKNSYYIKGTLFNPISSTSFYYNGTGVQFSTYVSDWGASYYETVSSVFCMTVQFSGTQYNNLTKIYLDGSNSIISDFRLNSAYVGNFRVVQANTLNEIIVIVRSMAAETSSGRESYILNWLGMAQVQGGPYEFTSSSTSLNIIDTGVQGSSPVGLEAFDSSTSQSSSTAATNVVSNTPSQSSASETVSTISTSSIQTSSTITLSSTDKVSSQSSSLLTMVAISNVCSQTSSETPTQVNPATPVVSFYYSPSHPHKNETVVFNASLSYDPNGYIVSYNWNFGDGNTTNTVSPIITHSYTIAVSYDVVLNVTNNQGLWTSLTKPITIYESAIHDISIISATASKTVVGKSFNLGINVAVKNEGDLIESFNVTVYANITTIGKQTVTLSSGNSTTAIRN